jgi:DNA-binding MarR family transcriptional regulator
MRRNQRASDVARGLLLGIGLLRRRLRAVPFTGGLTLPETAALRRLHRGGPVTAADLARQEQISPQSIGITLAGLEVRDLISRERDPNEGRRILLSISTLGRRELDELRSAHAARLAACVADLTDEEHELLERAIPLINRLADEV